ncbi:hypothetical protein SAMN05444349_104118 [Bacteroides faecichinchillae]|uniref:Uncharacterized protein n=1 Tax=Bacteroides faecichinchillae TaxID=871325 RepID=A0A1M4V7I8_9BACE|nr:hypothetical protein SAMN05444349_104118 [Bacteroides faecichinchillae]
MFPYRVLLVDRAKNTTFSDSFQDETLNLYVVASKKVYFDVCVHKNDCFRARKNENTVIKLKNFFDFEGMYYLYYRRICMNKP